MFSGKFSNEYIINKYIRGIKVFYKIITKNYRYLTINYLS